MLKDKKIIIIGDKDGIAGSIIEDCIKTTEGEVIYTVTECFGCMIGVDINLQKKIKELAIESASKPVIILGSAEAETTELFLETIYTGDPTGLGPLDGTKLGVEVYHITEAVIKNECDEAVYKDKCGFMEMVIDTEGISNIMLEKRNIY